METESVSETLADLKPETAVSPRRYHCISSLRKLQDIHKIYYPITQIYIFQIHILLLLPLLFVFKFIFVTKYIVGYSLKVSHGRHVYNYSLKKNLI
jgi:hypothetical protein